MHWLKALSRCPTIQRVQQRVWTKAAAESTGLTTTCTSIELYMVAEQWSWIPIQVSSEQQHSTIGTEQLQQQQLSTTCRGLDPNLRGTSTTHAHQKWQTARHKQTHWKICLTNWHPHTNLNSNHQHTTATTQLSKNGNTSLQRTWVYEIHSTQGCSTELQQHNNTWQKQTHEEQPQQ